MSNNDLQSWMRHAKPCNEEEEFGLCAGLLALAAILAILAFCVLIGFLQAPSV